jgi:hypothetical protein
MPKSHRQRARLEQWLDNPRCDKNGASAVLNIPMLEIANHMISKNSLAQQSVVATDPKEISKFARTLGQNFEASLFEGEPALLLQLLVQAGLIDKDHRVEVIDRLAQGSRQEQLEESHRVLKLISAADGKTVFVANGFRLPATFLPPDSTLEIDILVARPAVSGRYEIVLGEVKVYPDKGGRTDRMQIASARSQLGLYANIVREWLPQLNQTENLSYSGSGFFVLTDPAGSAPVISALENMDEQEARARTAIAAIHSLDFIDLQQEEDSVKRLDSIAQLPSQFKEGCWGNCAMAEVCFADVRGADSTLVLGSKIEQQLGQIRLHQAVLLADGKVQPIGALEADLAQRFDDAVFPEIEGLEWK